MRELLARLLSERANIWEGTKALLDTVEAESRDLSGEEQADYARRTADLDALDARIRDLNERIAAESDAAEARARAEALIRPAETAPPATTQTADERALAFFRGQAGRALDTRDLSKLSAGAGANTVPTSFDARLVEHMVEAAQIRTVANVLTTTSGENIQVPKTTAHGAAAMLAEADPIAESDPVFGQATLAAYKFGVLIQVSQELVTDTAVDLLGYIARQAGRALGLASGTYYATGTGTSQPQGIVVGSTLGKTGSASVAGAFSADDLIDLYHSVISPYRNSPSAAWVMKDSSVAALRKLKDLTTGSNQYLWQPGLAAGQPDTVLGKPLLTDPNIAAVALSAKSVIFGDMNAFVIRDVAGVRFERSDDFAFANDLVTFRALLRTDSRLVDATGAVKHFIGNAA